MSAAGKRRERVELQDPPSQDDGAGGQTGGWTTVATLWAEVRPIGGDEAVAAGIVDSVVKYRVTIARRAIASGQRLTWAGMALDVRAVLPTPRRDDTVLICEGVRL